MLQVVGVGKFTSTACIHTLAHTCTMACANNCKLGVRVITDILLVVNMFVSYAHMHTYCTYTHTKHVKHALQVSLFVAGKLFA